MLSDVFNRSNICCGSDLFFKLELIKPQTLTHSLCSSNKLILIRLGFSTGPLCYCNAFHVIFLGLAVIHCKKVIAGMVNISIIIIIFIFLEILSHIGK